MSHFFRRRRGERKLDAWGIMGGFLACQAFCWPSMAHCPKVDKLTRKEERRGRKEEKGRKRRRGAEGNGWHGKLRAMR